MRTITIFFENGEILRDNVQGTNPEIQRAFKIGTLFMDKIIKALTIEN